MECRPRRAKRYCCVVNCHNSELYSNPAVKFFAFPWKRYEKERRQNWILAVNRVNRDGSPWQPSKYTKICGQHFIGGKPSNIQMHPDYNPTIFPASFKKGERGKTSQMEHRLSVDCDINIHEERPSILDVPNAEEPQFIKSEPTWSFDENEHHSALEFPVENQLMIKLEPGEIFSDPGVEDIRTDIIKEEHVIQDVQQSPCEMDYILPDAGCDNPETNVAEECGIHMTDIKKEVLDEEYDVRDTTPIDDQISTSSSALKISRNRSGKKKRKENSNLYSCATCEKTVTSRRLLPRHMRLHSGDKPYLCSICGKVFRVRCNLDSHVRAHSGVRPYKCMVCGRAFVQLNNLKSHLTVHSRDKPYSCLKCGKLFSMDRYLKRHVNRYCKKSFSGDFCE